MKIQMRKGLVFMKTEQLKRSLMLVLTALIWGIAFVAQSVGVQYVGPFTFNAIRTFIGGLVLLPCIPLLDKMKKTPKEELRRTLKSQRKTLLLGGALCGSVLAIASILQQFGLLYATPGKAGFITALYIVIVPGVGVFMKKKPSPLLWISVALAAVGMYLLCVTNGFSLSNGDLFLIASAAFFAIHILVIDRFSPRVDGVRLSMIQFFVCSFLCAVFMFTVETPSVENVLNAWLPILYAGALSCGVGYTLQIVGQKNMNPTVASLILSLESVFSALAGWLILHQSLNERELVGCALIFCAILLAQLPAPTVRKESKAYEKV